MMETSASKKTTPTVTLTLFHVERVPNPEVNVSLLLEVRVLPSDQLSAKVLRRSRVRGRTRWSPSGD